MLDIKAMKSALEQLEAERGISKEKIFEAIEAALAAAYKKDFGKKDQMIRAKLDMNSGAVEFEQIKKVVDETRVRFVEDDEELPPPEEPKEGEEADERVRFNTERHILIDDAKLLKKNVELDEEISFPLDAQDDFGRIAAQTAKQVVIQKIREAERSSVLDEFGKRGKEIVTGIVQRIERGTVFVDLGRAIGIIGHDDQVPGAQRRIEHDHVTTTTGSTAKSAEVLQRVVGPAGLGCGLGLCLDGDQYGQPRILERTAGQTHPGRLRAVGHADDGALCGIRFRTDPRLGTYILDSLTGVSHRSASKDRRTVRRLSPRAVPHHRRLVALRYP